MTPITPAQPAFRWLVRLVAVSSCVLFPWAAYLAATLPASVSARHWPLAWTGLDVAMAAGLAATAWFAIRRDRRLAFPAVSTASLLLADAWFDVCTAPTGGPLAMALLDMGIEVAEALGCLALAVAIWRTTPAVREPVVREPAVREPAVREPAGGSGLAAQGMPGTRMGGHDELILRSPTRGRRGSRGLCRTRSTMHLPPMPKRGLMRSASRTHSPG